MTPPPIRYPLPMLLVAIALALLIWRGERWTRPLRAVLAERWMRAVEGPPIPSSTEPKVVAGPIVRKVLLLRAPVPATDRPGGRVVETIRRRGLYDVYDLWPLQGRPTHDRIGNRRPIGWVAAEVVLPWDTRLVLRAPEGKLDLADQPERRAKSSVAVGAIPLPVVAWTDHAIEVAVWEADRPWSAIARRGWIASEEIPSEAWGVLLSSAECRALLDPPPPAEAAISPRLIRLRAVLGRLLEARPLTREDLDAARAALPAPVFRLESDFPVARRELLLRLYEDWEADASWAEFTFRFVPLKALP